MNALIQPKTTPALLIALALLCFAALPRAHAVVPPPDGGYPGFNTAEGQNALFSLTTESFNTAMRSKALSVMTSRDHPSKVGSAKVSGKKISMPKQTALKVMTGASAFHSGRSRQC